MCPQLC